MRPIFAKIATTDARNRPAGQDLVSGCGVVHIAVGHRPNNGEPVGLFCELGKVFANRYVGNTCGNRAELAPEFRGGRGLQIPGVLLSRPAPHE